MDQRQIIGAVAGPVFGGGVTAALASLNPAFHEYHTVLVGLGTAGLTAAVTTWGLLYLTRPNIPKSDERQYLSVPDAGDALYLQGSPGLKRWLLDGVPDQFGTLRDHGAAFVHAAATEGICKLYGRRGTGYPLEQLDPDDIEMDKLAALLQNEAAALANTYIRRNDLRTVLEYYNEAIRGAISPE